MSTYFPPRGVLRKWESELGARLQRQLWAILDGTSFPHLSEGELGAEEKAAELLLGNGLHNLWHLVE